MSQSTSYKVRVEFPSDPEIKNKLVIVLGRSNGGSARKDSRLTNGQLMAWEMWRFEDISRAIDAFDAAKELKLIYPCNLRLEEIVPTKRGGSTCSILESHDFK